MFEIKHLLHDIEKGRIVFEISFKGYRKIITIQRDGYKYHVDGLVALKLQTTSVFEGLDLEKLIEFTEACGELLLP